MHSLYSVVETLLVMTYGVLPAVWARSGTAVAAAAAKLQQLSAAAAGSDGLAAAAGGRLAAVAGWMGSAGGGEIAQTVVFVLVVLLCNLVMELPWGLYSTFVVEQRHGFNKQTLGLYVSDLVKQVRRVC